jgi:hypothetical protein
MKRVDLEVAVAAGLVVAFPLYKILTLPDFCGSPNHLTPGGAVALLFAIASYLVSPFLLGLFAGRRAVRFIWLWIPVLGSLLIATVLYSLGVRSADWGLGQSAKAWLGLSLWTIPFAAVVYYSGVLVRAARRWYEGPKENLSILRR